MDDLPDVVQTGDQALSYFVVPTIGKRGCAMQPLYSSVDRIDADDMPDILKKTLEGSSNSQCKPHELQCMVNRLLKTNKNQDLNPQVLCFRRPINIDEVRGNGDNPMDMSVEAVSNPNPLPESASGSEEDNLCSFAELHYNDKVHGRPKTVGLKFLCGDKEAPDDYFCILK